MERGIRTVGFEEAHRLIGPPISDPDFEAKGYPQLRGLQHAHRREPLHQSPDPYFLIFHRRLNLFAEMP